MTKTILAVPTKKGMAFLVNPSTECLQIVKRNTPAKVVYSIKRKKTT